MSRRLLGVFALFVSLSLFACGETVYLNENGSSAGVPPAPAPEEPGSEDPPPAPPPPVPSGVDPALTDPNVFFFEGFESVGYGSRFTYQTKSEKMRLITGDRVLYGNSSLEIKFVGGTNSGGSLGYMFARAGLPEPEELYGRYYLRFNEDWDSGGGGKLPGPSGTYGRAGWGGRPSDGFNGWSARMGFSEPKGDSSKVRVHYYTYHVDSGTYGEWMLWDDQDLGNLDKERWYCIETYVKLNTPGQEDGILRGWVDGQLAMERTDIRFRDTTDLKIEEFWMNFYFGGLDPVPEDMHVYIDNVALSTHPIGPIK